MKVTKQSTTYMRKIEVVAYDKEWLCLFEIEKKLLISSLPIKKLRINHIGSTAVYGLAAKPVIDILLEVEKVETLDEHNEIFESIGYECKGEFGIAGRRYFQKGGNNRSHQIHAFCKGSSDAIRHLAFTEYLRAYPNVAEEYAVLKKAIAENCNNDIEAYCDGKDDFVKEYEKKAVSWRKNSNKGGGMSF